MSLILIRVPEELSQGLMFASLSVDPMTSGREEKVAPPHTDRALRQDKLICSAEERVETPSEFPWKKEQLKEFPEMFWRLRQTPPAECWEAVSSKALRESSSCSWFAAELDPPHDVILSSSMGISSSIWMTFLYVSESNSIFAMFISLVMCWISVNRFEAHFVIWRKLKFWGNICWTLDS
jgi:hypothetical protein